MTDAQGAAETNPRKVPSPAGRTTSVMRTSRLGFFAYAALALAGVVLGCVERYLIEHLWTEDIHLRNVAWTYLGYLYLALEVASVAALVAIAQAPRSTRVRPRAFS